MTCGPHERSWSNRRKGADCQVARLLQAVLRFLHRLAGWKHSLNRMYDRTEMNGAVPCGVSRLRNRRRARLAAHVERKESAREQIEIGTS